MIRFPLTAVSLIAAICTTLVARAQTGTHHPREHSSTSAPTLAPREQEQLARLVEAGRKQRAERIASLKAEIEKAKKDLRVANAQPKGRNRTPTEAELKRLQELNRELKKLGKERLVIPTMGPFALGAIGLVEGPRSLVSSGRYVSECRVESIEARDMRVRFARVVGTLRGGGVRSDDLGWSDQLYILRGWPTEGLITGATINLEGRVLYISQTATIDLIGTTTFVFEPISEKVMDAFNVSR